MGGFFLSRERFFFLWPEELPTSTSSAAGGLAENFLNSRFFGSLVVTNRITSKSPNLVRYLVVASDLRHFPLRGGLACHYQVCFTVGWQLRDALNCFHFSLGFCKLAILQEKRPFWLINWSLPNHKTDCRDGRDCKTGSSIYLHFPDRDSKSKAQR